MAVKRLEWGGGGSQHPSPFAPGLFNYSAYNLFFLSLSFYSKAEKLTR